VSLIENALEKLRRGSEGAIVRPDLIAARAASAASLSLSSSSTAAATEHALKRINIDLAAIRSAGYLPEESQERRFADHYRQIKRPLIENALASDAAPDMRTILVSSALPGDGKTFTAINLALSLARERDVSVLLVDADVPKAHITSVFGLADELGLLDALTDESLDVSSLIVRTDIRGLDILPAGRLVDGATELLASGRMAQIAARLNARSARRLALFDTSPLLVSSEARALVRLPAQIVLVVRAGMTPRHAVLEALTHVDPKKMQGFVLNQMSIRKGDGYYGYSYYEAAPSGSPEGG
jgi:protein-tyrosine kinase